MRPALHRLVRTGLALAVIAVTAVQPALAADDLVVDDAAANVQFKGTWATSTNGSGFFGRQYRFRVAGDGSSSVRWPFPGAAPGTFDVFARWTSGANRASNATYTVAHDEGARAVTVDQRTVGGT